MINLSTSHFLFLSNFFKTMWNNIGKSRLLFFFLILFIYLFMAVLGLRFCARAFSSCGKWGPLFIAVRGPLTIAASLVAEHRLSNCGSRAQLLRGMWDLPRSGLEPVSPALAGRFSTTAPPGKPRLLFFKDFSLGISVLCHQISLQCPWKWPSLWVSCCQRSMVDHRNGHPRQSPLAG